jgi:hypothetical protein
MPFHGVAGGIGYNIGAAEVVGVNVKNISLSVFQFYECVISVETWYGVEFAGAGNNYLQFI